LEPGYVYSGVKEQGMSTVIAIAGKGGTGKTTIAGLIVRYLKHTGNTPILAVDADADSNLPQALGMADNRTIGTIGKARQDFFVSKGDVPPGMPKEAYLELKLNEVVIESEDVDLLVMGRPEGAGCYCYINNVLRHYLESLGKNYPFVVIDNEAGLEHLSRRTAQHIDFLIVVSDYSLNGLRAAGRIRELSEELDIAIGQQFLLINRVPGEPDPSFTKKAEEQGVNLLGFIPADDAIYKSDLAGKPVVALPEESIAVKGLHDVMKQIIPTTKAN
jgi:CO dehydrogenase maturation factor